jgi:hypothetical protein
MPTEGSQRQPALKLPGMHAVIRGYWAPVRLSPQLWGDDLEMRPATNEVDFWEDSAPRLDILRSG